MPLPKLKTRLARVAAYASRGAGALPGPAAISVETTVRCNLRCPMCPRTGGGYPQADMPGDLLYPLLEEHAALGGDYIYLYGLGEPFMDPRLFDILQRCRALGLGTIVSTNATFLDRERRRRLLEVGCDHLICSLDADTRPTYERYRPGGDFDRVVEDVASLGREKARARSPMHLTVQLVRMKGNQAEEAAFLRRWQRAEGVDAARLKEEELGFTELGLVPADGHRRVNPCHILWRGPLIVRWDGAVHPCHPFAATEAPIGDLRRASLEEIWRGEAMAALRGLHAAGRHAEHPRCASCPIARPRLPFILGALAVDGIAAQRLIPVAERWAARTRGLFQEDRRPGAAGGGGDGG